MKTPSSQNLTRTLSLALLLIGFLVLASCSSKQPVAMGPVHTFDEEAGGNGFAGQSLIQSRETNATVMAIDPTTRRIVLQYPGGGSNTYRAGPEIANFGKIKVGDHVKTKLTEQMGLKVVSASALAAGTNQAPIFRSPAGLELGPKPVATMKFTAKILTLDPFERTITVQFADGTSRAIKVRVGIELGGLSPGDAVSVLVTEEMTLILENP